MVYFCGTTYGVFDLLARLLLLTVSLSFIVLRMSSLLFERYLSSRIVKVHVLGISLRLTDNVIHGSKHQRFSNHIHDPQ